jgi:hypothetical protein
MWVIDLIVHLNPFIEQVPVQKKNWKNSKHDMHLLIQHTKLLNLLRETGGYLRWVSSKKESDSRCKLAPVPTIIVDSSETINTGNQKQWNTFTIRKYVKLRVKWPKRAHKFSESKHSRQQFSGCNLNRLWIKRTTKRQHGVANKTLHKACLDPPSHECVNTTGMHHI